MMRNSLRVVLVCACMTLVGVLAACSNSQTRSQEDPPGFWKARFQEALSSPDLAPFEEQALSDFEVSDAEYQEASRLFIQCMENHGWKLKIESDGSNLISQIPGRDVVRNEYGAVHEDVYFGCQQGTFRYVGWYYLEMRDNPQELATNELIRQCYEANGVPDGKSLPEDQFSEMLGDPEYHASTPEGVLCYWDPTGSEGLTLEEAQDLDKNSRTEIIFDDEVEITTGG